MCSYQILYAMVHMDIVYIISETIFTGRPDEGTEPPGTSEKSEEAGAVLLKQSKEETNSRNDRQQVELTLPSSGRCCNLCIFYYKVSFRLGILHLK